MKHDGDLLRMRMGGFWLVLQGVEPIFSTQKRQTRVSLPLMKIKLERCWTYFR